MDTVPTVIDTYEEAIGQSPSETVARSRRLGPPELAAIMNVHVANKRASKSRSVGNGDIWPLVSHHTYADRALFGTKRQILPRTLPLLLLHDGLVVANPLETVFQVLTTKSESDAVQELARATSDLAEVESLIVADVLRLTPLRPTLEEANRAAVLEAFGLTPSLSVFTEFIGAMTAIPSFPGAFERRYASQVQDLYAGFGVRVPPPPSLREAGRAVRELAAAVIEVTWQFAVAATDASCDLAFQSQLERHLAEEVVHAVPAEDLGAGRHFQTLDLGLVPNLDVSQLSMTDALAIRREDSFEEFRHIVRSGLNELEVAKRAGTPPSNSKATFEEAMREGSRSLRHSVERATFGDRMKDMSMPAALLVATEITVAPAGPFAAAGAAGVASVATVVWEWLNGRKRDKDHQVSQRYLSMLGGRERRRLRTT